MLRRQKKSVMAEVIEEVPPLEFSRLGYPRNHTRTPSPCPATRSSRNISNDTRTQSSNPASKLFRKNSKISDVKPANSKAKVVKKVKSRLLTNTKLDDISNSSAKASNKPPRISRRKERQEARDNILNQLKDRGSRDTSRTRPPLPLKPNPVLSNVVNQVYLAQRLHSSLRSQSFASTTPHRIKNIEVKNTGEFEGNPSNNPKGQVKKEGIKKREAKNQDELEGNIPNSSNSSNSSKGQSKMIGIKKIETKNTDEFEGNPSKSSEEQRKKVGRRKSSVATTSSMETLRILNASQTAAGAKKDSLPNKSYGSIESDAILVSISVPTARSINNLFSRSNITTEENRATNSEIVVNAPQKDVSVAVESEELMMIGEIVHTDDSGWNCFQCATTPMPEVISSEDEIKKREPDESPINEGNNFEEDLTASDRSEDEPQTPYIVYKDYTESRVVVCNKCKVDKARDVKNMRLNGSLLMQLSETMADEDNDAPDHSQFGRTSGISSIGSKLTGTTGLLSGSTAIAVASNEEKDETTSLSSRFLCCG